MTRLFMSFLIFFFLISTFPFYYSYRIDFFAYIRSSWWGRIEFRNNVTSCAFISRFRRREVGTLRRRGVFFPYDNGRSLRWMTCFPFWAGARGMRARLKKRKEERWRGRRVGRRRRKRSIFSCHSSTLREREQRQAVMHEFCSSARSFYKQRRRQEGKTCTYSHLF